LRRGGLYRIGALPFRLYRSLLGRPQRSLEAGYEYSGERLMGPEVRAALAGRYGATTRLSGGQRSVTLYTAIPIRRRNEVIGVALVSQSTLAILQALDAVRLDIFKVVVASVAVAAILSLFISTTIASPLRRLRAEARAIVDRRGRLKAGFRRMTGADEIADLSRALEELTGRLRDYTSFVETFASDVSHEFKNPLAAVRSATEALPQIDDAQQRRRFITIVEREVARMEHMLSGVGEVARIDAQLDNEESTVVDLRELLGKLLDGYRVRNAATPLFQLEGDGGPFLVRACADRLTQVFENLLDNAVSFSPQGGTVVVGLLQRRGRITASVADEGPGIPDEHRERIFHRFFSYRDEGASANDHLGLGLSIARAIAEGYGGAIRAGNLPAGGARFEVDLPAATESPTAA
jgi:two-component system sensor histidine kinase ChvG